MLSLLLVASILLSLTAGACAYLFLLNRFLIQLRDARHKSWLIRAGTLLTLGCAGVLGYLAAGTPWMILPTAVVMIALAGEVRRWMVRRRCRGEPPVAQENAGVRLTRPRTTTDLAVRRYALAVLGWNGPPLRIAHISDFHVNSHLPLAYFEDAMRRVADAQPDLLFFTGDFITDIRFVDLLPGVLSLARGRLGTFGVLGNHDHWADAAAVTDAVHSAGVTLLGDGSVHVPIGNGNGVLVTGCEAPWSHRPWGPPAAASGELALVLTHTPDNVYRLSRLGYAAIFAGHYHAGQMRLPGLGPLVVPSNYGRRFDHGHFVLDGTHLFVTAGVGSAEPAVRVWCQPDIFIVDIKGTQRS